MYLSLFWFTLLMMTKIVIYTFAFIYTVCKYLSIFNNWPHMCDCPCIVIVFSCCMIFVAIHILLYKLCLMFIDHSYIVYTLFDIFLPIHLCMIFVAWSHFVHMVYDILLPGHLLCVWYFFPSRILLYTRCDILLPVIYSHCLLLLYTCSWYFVAWSFIMCMTMIFFPQSDSIVYTVWYFIACHLFTLSIIIVHMFMIFCCLVIYYVYDYDIFSPVG